MDERLNAEALEALEFARVFAGLGEAQVAREEAGYSRSEFIAFADNAFALPTLISWERGRRRPHGARGAAYGRALRRLVGL